MSHLSMFPYPLPAIELTGTSPIPVAALGMALVAGLVTSGSPTELRIIVAAGDHRARLVLARDVQLLQGGIEGSVRFAADYLTGLPAAPAEGA